jgi:hypothetical protein
MQLTQQIPAPTAVNGSAAPGTLAAAATVNKTCDYESYNYTDFGNLTATSLSAIDTGGGNYAAQVYSNIAQQLPSLKTGFAWTNIGLDIRFGGFPSGSTITAKYQWHVRGHMAADADYGAHGEARAHVVLGLWDITNGVKNVNQIWGRTVTADGVYPQGSSVDAFPAADYNSTTNGMDMGIAQDKTIRTYIHLRTDTEAKGSATATGTGHGEGDFFDSSSPFDQHAWVPFWRIIFHLPSGWTVTC